MRLFKPVDQWVWNSFEKLASGQPVPFTIRPSVLDDGRIGYVDSVSGRGCWIIGVGVFILLLVGSVPLPRILYPAPHPTPWTKDLPILLYVFGPAGLFGAFLVSVGVRVQGLRRVLAFDPDKAEVAIELVDRGGHVSERVRRPVDACHVQIHQVEFGNQNPHLGGGPAEALVLLFALLLSRAIRKTWFAIVVHVGPQRFLIACERELAHMRAAREEMPSMLDDLGLGEGPRLWLNARTRWFPRKKHAVALDAATSGLS